MGGTGYILYIFSSPVQFFILSAVYNMSKNKVRFPLALPFLTNTCTHPHAMLTCRLEWTMLAVYTRHAVQRILPSRTFAAGGLCTAQWPVGHTCLRGCFCSELCYGQCRPAQLVGPCFNLCRRRQRQYKYSSYYQL